MKEQTEIDLEIKKVLKSNNQKAINCLLDGYQEADIAETIDGLKNEKKLKVFNAFNQENRQKLFPYLDHETQEYIIDNLNNANLESLINNMYSDDLVDLIDELPKTTVKKILNVTTKEKRKELNNILQHEEETAGGMMSVNFLKLQKDLSVGEAIQKVKEVHNQLESVDNLFIIDQFETLVGEVKLKELLFNDDAKKLQDIMDTSIVYAPIDTDQEEVANMFKRYDINVLPVIGEDNKMAGVITIDDVVDVIDRETTEDIQKFAGITPFNDDDPFKISVWKMVLSRSLWVVISLLLATIAQILLVVFYNAYGLGTLLADRTTKEFAAVFLLSPMVIVIASVCGLTINQSTSNVIRGLSLEESDKKEMKHLVNKELLTSVILAAFVVVINLVRLVIFYAAEFHEVSSENLWYSIATSSVSLVIVIILSGILGTMLPIAAKKMKKDPAMVSSPLISGIIDIIAIAVFFGIGLAFY
ncbi:magnesium transporter [Mesoplasma lactucae]|uniref:Magnesium transporter MgtE n=1 Tax=Mesoplasma lactucae ATCC 49193 TaxID=81460 RepID=A0A291IS90_9MOLU|nr:magnesium transporter [Mesoplasma lactucae]ATG97633.1 magnesium transporter [Mesoplasma lactucae ATCC 49193]ATZ19906.1 Mg2+ transport protein [Mesoplasma lactucae ATCC 49193]MCL8216770.1 Magnesium transporter MgtE [Mesoplasma lactucae ATCC 49193]